MNIKDIFPSPWLTAEDLGNRRVEVTIAAFEMVEVHNRETNRKERKPAVAFVKATKKLIFNKTQGFALAHLFGEETDAWVGKRIALRKGRTPNGKDTIVVEAASVPATATMSEQQREGATDGQ